MKAQRPDVDLRYRSLLQKAVRRGAVNLVITTCGILERFGAKEKNWLEKRAVVIAFEECWPMGSELVFTKHFHSKVAALVKTAGAVKDRDAAGLGSLAYELYKGDRSVLDGSPEDRSIRIVAKGIQRPEDFWKWIGKQKVTGPRKALAQNANRFTNIGRPREKAYTLAAAYLAVTQPFPDMTLPAQINQDFPYWIVFDRHTRQGRRALQDIARDLHIELTQLEWAYFYFESGAAGDAVPSKWWQRYCRWRFNQAGLPVQEARLFWEPVKPQLMKELAEDGFKLHKEVYQWKMANWDRVESLKKKVELYIAKFNVFQKEQLALF